MAVVNMRELARSTSRVVDAVHRSGKAALVTRAGRPIVAVIPIDEAALEDWVLANSAGFVRSLRAADADLHGGHAFSLDEFLTRNPARKTRITKARKRPTRSG